MAKSRKIGRLGFSIPAINPSNVPRKPMTTEDVLQWRAALPLADIGVAARKLYVALSELNETVVDPATRFAIIELFRPTTKTIATALKKHYIEQVEPLTPQKLTIANLRQTLIAEVADNYKTILEELDAKPDKTEEDNRIIITTVCRILYYLNAILLCRYQIYAAVPEGLWREIHTLYKYAVDHKILDIQVGCELAFNHTTTIIGSYTRILLLSATDPHQWRQKDQYSINKAIDLWAVYPTIYNYKNIPEKTEGIFIIDLEQDLPPIPLSFKRDPITASCIALDVAKNVTHLKHLLLKMRNKEVKVRIDHPGDAEFSVTIPTLLKLIQIWSQRISRHTQRFRISAKIKVAFGLRAAYFYINGQKEFDPRPSHISLSTAVKTGPTSVRPTLDLPIFEVEDEDVEDTGATTKPKDKEDVSSETKAEAKEEALPAEEEVDRIENRYPCYDYMIENISTNGFCIRVDDGTFPPFRVSEIMIFKNFNESENAPWSIGAVRWIRSPSNGVYLIGIELVAPYAKTAGIQMVRNEQPAGLLLRCLILPEEPGAPTELITPTLPIQSNKVFLYLDDQKGIKTTLVKETESTSGYHKFVYSTKENISINEPKNGEAVVDKQVEETIEPDQDEDKTNTEFDSIWKDL